MFSIKNFETIVNVFMGIILCIALSLVVLLLHNNLGLEPFVLSFLTSFAVSYTVSDLLPVKDIGDKLPKRLGLKEGTLAFFMISTFISVFVMILLVSFLLVLLNVGFKPFLFAAWLSTFPILLLVCYVIELFTLPIAVKTAIALTSNNEIAEQ